MMEDRANSGDGVVVVVEIQFGGWWLFLRRERILGSVDWLGADGSWPSGDNLVKLMGWYSVSPFFGFLTFWLFGEQFLDDPLTLMYVSRW